MNENIEKIYNYCINEKYSKNLNEYFNTYYTSNDNIQKIELTVKLMDEIKKLKKYINFIMVFEENIKKETLKYYREILFILEDMKLCFRYFHNRILLLKNNTIKICQSIKNNPKLNKFIKNIKYIPRFKHSINKEEQKTFNILKKILSKYPNYIICPNKTLKAKHKSLLRADFLVYLDILNDIKFIVEYDGESHYNPNYIYYTEENIIRDRKKDSYCISNNISVIRYNDHNEFIKILPTFLKDLLEKNIVMSCHYKDIYNVISSSEYSHTQ